MKQRAYSSNYEGRGANARFMREPARAQAILKIALKRNGIDRQLARYNFVLHWKEIVGDEIAKRSRPECIRDDVLIVRVADSSWAQELSFQKKIILARLQRHLGESDVVRDVQFYVVGEAGLRR